MSRVALETTTAEFGMRLTGAQLWDNVRGEYSGIPKSFGKTIDRTGTDLQIKFNTFFPISDPRLSRVSQEGLTYSSGGLPSGLLKQIIDRSIIPKIQRILTYLSSFNWRIYGASLLIIFEADFDTLDSILSSSILVIIMSINYSKISLPLRLSTSLMFSWPIALIPDY
ncbi:hypothetical protein KEM48_003803 [Puccinia striiformis f. sp. tritici PST-130]|nr:hypothetical protein KEM48_003803 [Puccinia striiformis f. sp. tritici PST-130]